MHGSECIIRFIGMSFQLSHLKIAHGAKGWVRYFSDETGNEYKYIW